MENKTIKLDKDQYKVFLSRIKYHLENHTTEGYAEISCFFILKRLFTKCAKKVLDNQNSYKVDFKDFQLAAIAWMLAGYDLIDIDPYEFTVWQLFYQKMEDSSILKLQANGKN